MSNGVKEIFVLDVREIVTYASKAMGIPLNRKETSLVSELLLKVELIANDLITKLTQWSDIETDIYTDKYIPIYDPKTTTVEVADMMYDEMNRIINRLEIELDELPIFPTWGYPTVKIVGHNLVIVVAGDYRIDDWMRQNEKHLKRNNNILKLVRNEEL